MNITRIITKCFTFGEKAVKHVLKAKPKKIEGLALKTLNHDVVQISKSAAKETSAATSAISQKLTKITATAEAATKSATKASSEVAKTISLKETTHAAKTVIKQEEAISRAAQRVSGDKDVQKALVELTKKEGIIIRTKEDAFPILRKQYQSLSPKEQKNLFILNINPQTNNGMPKSNTLISQWYAEANGIDPSRIITINPEEMLSKNLALQKICSEWKAGNKSASSIMKKVARIKPEENPMSLDKARKLIDEIKGLPEEEILKKASIDEIAQAIEKVNTSLIRPFKQGGYTTALASQIQEITSKANGKVHFVIPDDCSLSGSSIICDSARIIERAFPQGTAGREVKFIFSPMIFGEKAEEVIGKFAVKQGLTDEAFLRRINAIAVDGKENFPGARKVFQNIEKLTGIEFKTTSEARKAVHFTETETFKKLGETNPVLQQKLLYIMQGPMSESGHLFGGFGNCGVMVITPTENFVIDGVKYAGKVPTNSVGFMEAVGLESGVLNDFLPKDPKGKGLFIKGTGKGYQRYIEWENLFNPTSINDRIPIIIDGTTIRKACLAKYICIFITKIYNTNEEQHMFIDKNPIRKITNHIVNNYSDSPNAAAAIDDLVAKLKSFANMDEAIDILDSFKKSIKDVEYDPRYGTYRYLNYYIRPGLKSENTNYITNLQFINKLGHCKTSAPEIIHHGRSRDNQFDVIIYKVNDTKGGALRHLTSLSEIKPKQKEQFISEQINLLEDTGLYNSAVIDSFDDWYLTPDTNNIYIDSWNSLVKCFSAKQKEKVKEILKNKI